MAMTKDEVNNSFGKKVLCKCRKDKDFIGYINSDVSNDLIVGLDLKDGSPINFLAHIYDLTLIEN